MRERELVVDRDAEAAGARVRARLDSGLPVAGFVGDPDDPAVAEFVADLFPGSAGETQGRPR